MRDLLKSLAYKLSMHSLLDVSGFDVLESETSMTMRIPP